MSVHYGYPDPETEQAETIIPTVPLPPGQTLKGRIEAVLFMTGKALSLGEIAQMVDAPYEETEFALVELMGDFREGSSLEIDDTDGYILQVKEEYGDIVNKMMPLEMSAAELRTLSAIAIKAPVLQSDLIEWRGSVAYEHIAQLLQRKLISKRREGRSYILNVTRNFHEYFKLTADKKDLASLVKLIGKEEGSKSRTLDTEEFDDETPTPPESSNEPHSDSGEIETASTEDIIGS
jgi:segregation and condensation protein B